MLRITIMKKNWLTVVCFLVSIPLFSQSRNQIVSDLVNLLKGNNDRLDVFYTEVGRELNINGNQVPIANVKYRYKESNGARLEFECVSISKRNCIYKPTSDKYFEKFEFPMENEKSVYKAINLLNQVLDTY